MAISAYLLWASTAHAQSAAAETMFDDGNKLMAQGKLAEACTAFQTSNRLEPRAGTLIRIGECREQLHQIASAWSAYNDALTRVKDPQKKAIATAKVAELQPRLSYVTVEVPAASKLDGLVLTRDDKPIDPGLWNIAVPIDGGTYTIAARAPGHGDWTTTVVVPDEAGKIAVTVPKLEATSAEPAHPATGPVPRAAVLPAAPRTDEPGASRWTARRKTAIATAAVGVAGGIAGVVLGELAKGKQHDAEGLCTPDVPCADGGEAQSLIDAAHSRALDANIAFGVAGAAVIATAVLWLTGAPERAPRVTLAPTFHAGAVTMALTGRF